MESEEDPENSIPLSDHMSHNEFFRTETQILQAETDAITTERIISHIMIPQFNEGLLIMPELLKDKHLKYIRSVITSPSPSNEYFDSIRPWALYWTLNSLTLLGEEIDEDLSEGVAQALWQCRDPRTGAYCGGAGQIPHIGVTYAAICTISMLGEPYMRDLIDRPKILSWLESLKQPDGSFEVHNGGEVDLRGTYCAVAVADMLNLKIDISGEVGDFVARCQTHEGGLGGVPGAEAHGGYTYCGLAALMILGQEHKVNAKLMANWVSSLQGMSDGGFRGRTNKIVDGCYSFWQGAVIVFLKMIFDGKAPDVCNDFFNREALQMYLLTCCQYESGGFSDRPDRLPDIYHTCYCISGYSLSTRIYLRCKKTNKINVVNLHNNATHTANEQMETTHPYYNVRIDFADAIKSFYLKEDGKLDSC